jgi:hypothetical protein
MKIYTEKSLFIPGAEGNVYVLETMEDWDEYEKILKEMDQDFLKWNPNFYSFKKDFKKYIGKIWQDKNQLRYMFNGEPVYVEYKVIALEDDNPNMDWYWVVRNVDDDRDVKRVLANSWDMQNGIKI